jgi:hypothetical protein
MNRTFYKKGQKIDALSLAGENMWIYEAYGVKGDVFIHDKNAYIPLVNSEHQGQGNFKKWLDEIEKEFKKVQFNTVINPDLRAYLIKRGYIPETRSNNSRM